MALLSASPARADGREALLKAGELAVLCPAGAGMTVVTLPVGLFFTGVAGVIRGFDAVRGEPKRIDMGEAWQGLVVHVGLGPARLSCADTFRDLRSSVARSKLVAGPGDVADPMTGLPVGTSAAR